MSAATTTPAAPQRTLDVSGTAPVPFTRLIGVELRKAYDTRAGLWLLIVTGIIVAAVMAIVLAVTITQDVSMDLGSFIATTAYSSSILLPVIGILLITGEWGQRTAMVTFALEPRRPRVLLAKFVAGLILTFVVAAAAIVLGAIANVLYGAAQGGVDWSFGWSYFFGFLITQVFAMAIGYALAALFLNTPAAIVVYFVYSWVLPVVFGIGAALLDWFDKLRPWIDFNFAQTPLINGEFSVGDDLGHLLVSGFIWLVVPFAIGMRRVLSAEVK